MQPEPEPPPNIIATTNTVINHLAQELTYTPSRVPIQVPVDPMEVSETAIDCQYEVSTKTSKRLSTENNTAKPTTHQLYRNTKYNDPSIVRLLQRAKNTPFHVGENIQLHIDGGANRSITNNHKILIIYCNIKPYYMLSASEGDNIKCTAVGYIPWTSPDGACLLVKTYYSIQAVDTIISPSNIVLHYHSKYDSWTQHANMQTGEGYIRFHGTKCDEITFPLHTVNGLWYYNTNPHKDYIPLHVDSAQQHTALITCISSESLYELYHARLGHPGQKVMSMVHHRVEGIPKLTRPPLFQCQACMLAKVTKRAVHAQNQKDTSRSHKDSAAQPIKENERLAPGTHFHMDMGFVRGSKYRTKDEDGQMVTSLDGYNSYLLIIDRATRYMWVFLSKYKTPKIDTIRGFLQTHGAKGPQQRYVRTDKGGSFGDHCSSRIS